MRDYSRYAAIVLSILGIGFLAGGVVLFVIGDGIIDSSVTKVSNTSHCIFKRLIENFRFFFFFLLRVVN